MKKVYYSNSDKAVGVIMSLISVYCFILTLVPAVNNTTFNSVVLCAYNAFLMFAMIYETINRMEA
jgi:hypothetical protein